MVHKILTAPNSNSRALDMYGSDSERSVHGELLRMLDPVYYFYKHNNYVCCSFFDAQILFFLALRHRGISGRMYSCNANREGNVLLSPAPSQTCICVIQQSGPPIRSRRLGVNSLV